MKNQTVKKIVTLLDDLSDKKARSVIEYIQFLRWSDERFSEEEIAVIQKSRGEARKGEGAPWRNVRDDV
ncbi:MAG: hypothetical protein KAY24_06235 [Candidatus Eisenbacteria sp.]|nr:hypothetical protein [Candidatus Eisenbacteria bacterium]